LQNYQPTKIAFKADDPPLRAFGRPSRASFIIWRPARSHPCLRKLEIVPEFSSNGGRCPI